MGLVLERVAGIWRTSLKVGIVELYVELGLLVKKAQTKSSIDCRFTWYSRESQPRVRLRWARQ